MKFIIIGLGNFGASLAQKLTEQGHEVIGIDISMTKVDAYKEKITYTICMDATDEFTVAGLPLNETDVVLVAIGENQGANIMTTALLKNLKVKRLISRAINPLHEKVLQAIGVNEIVHPEEETAERWTKKLSLSNVVDSFELNDDYSIIEAKVPVDFVGKTIMEVGFRKDFNLLVLTIIKKVEVKSILGKTKSETLIQGVAAADDILDANDILVLYGSRKDLHFFLRHKLE
ncbi:MAG: TrkA family potassium uptake protein [Bacteroidales bacterium]|jgi:trk system potassium uptake protein TrkA|nr:TrkA family potassium uptake protein [Bacteroidales bacterium]